MAPVSVVRDMMWGVRGVLSAGQARSAYLIRAHHGALIGR
jgi:hypothetical protein